MLKTLIWICIVVLKKQSNEKTKESSGKGSKGNCPHVDFPGGYEWHWKLEGATGGMDANGLN